MTFSIYPGEFSLSFHLGFSSFVRGELISIRINRSKDGLNLWACSSDGLAAVASFSLSEFPPLVPEASRRDVLAAHGFVPRLLAPTPRNLSAQNSFVAGTGTAAQPNKLVARKGPNAKRARPVVLQTQPQPQPQVNGAQSSSSSAAAFASAPIVNHPVTNGNAFASTSAAQPSHNAFNGAAAYPPPPQLNHNSSSFENPRKRKASALPLHQIDDSNLYSAVGPWVPSADYQLGYGAPRLSDRDYRLVGHTLAGPPSPRDERPEPIVKSRSKLRIGYLMEKYPRKEVRGCCKLGRSRVMGSWESRILKRKILSNGGISIKENVSLSCFHRLYPYP